MSAGLQFKDLFLWFTTLPTPATVVVVKLKDPPVLCRTDEVGELCVHSSASASSYYRLQGRTAHTFQVSWEGGLWDGSGGSLSAVCMDVVLSWRVVVTVC